MHYSNLGYLFLILKIIFFSIPINWYNTNIDRIFLIVFQVGRSSESPIDFVVMDTLPGDKKDAKVMQSTISRFACRILVERTEAPRAKIYAAGFDSSRNIFLGVSLIAINISIFSIAGRGRSNINVNEHVFFIRKP